MFKKQNKKINTISYKKNLHIQYSIYQKKKKAGKVHILLSFVLQNSANATQWKKSEGSVSVRGTK